MSKPLLLHGSWIRSFPSEGKAKSVAKILARHGFGKSTDFIHEQDILGAKYWALYAPGKDKDQINFIQGFLKGYFSASRKRKSAAKLKA